MQNIENQYGLKKCDSQFFPLEGFKISYTLRTPKSNKPCLVYLTVHNDNVSIKLTTDVKVYPSQWDKQEKKAVISHKLTNLDNRNNEIANRRIDECSKIVNEIKYYLCVNPNEIDNGIKLIKNKIYEGKVMKKKKEVCGFEGGTKATFELMKLVEANSNITDSSKINKLRELKLFGDWMEANKIPNTWEGISKATLRKYENYLVSEKKLKQNTLSTKFAHVLSSINEAVNLDIYPNNINVGIQNFKLQKYKQTSLSKKFSLEKEEVDILYNLKGLTAIEADYRDLFVLQCEMGQRIGDMKKIIEGDYNVSECSGFLRLMQEKTNTYVLIPINERIKEILKRHKNDKWLKDTNKLGQNLNYHLKVIAKKANLNRLHTYEEEVNGTLKTLTKPIYKLLTSHYARHTFITLKLREGWDKENVKLVSGHADDDMIDKVYSHLTINDKENKLTKQINKTQNSISKEKIAIEPTTTITQDNKMINEAKEVLSMMRVDPSLFFNENDISTLWRMVTNVEGQLLEFGIDYKTVKEVFNEGKSLKERADILHQIYIDAKKNDKRSKKKK